MSKRVTNSDIYRELGEIQILVRELRYDVEEVKQMAPRIKSLELFRSYVKGGFAVVSTVCVSTFAALKGVFGHF